MANENLRIDENTRWVLGAITNDSNQEIRNVRVNPVTGRVLVEAVIASTNTTIGGTIPGGTPGSVLFIGPGSTLDQDNPNLFYDYTNFFLGLGTNTPDATLNVNGTVHFDLGGDATGDIFYRDAGGLLAPLGIGTAGQVLAVSGGLPSWVAATSLISGYNTIQDGGTPLTQRSTMNFVNYFTITDVSSVTTINLNTTELGADATLISTLETNLDLANISGFIDLSTQVTGVLSATNIDITNLESTLDLGNIAGAIDLTTQVTGILPVANIDVAGIANDVTFLATLIPNLDENVKVAVDGVTITGDGTTGNPLVSTGGTGLVTLDVFTSNGTWNKPVGAQKVLVEVFGAGGGGGGGGLAATTNAGSGGGAGGGGSYNKRWFDASELGATESVTVGVGGSGGAGTNTGPNGSAGSAGTGSSFGSLINAYGGNGGGPGGQSSAGTAGAGGTISIINPENVGGDGGAGNSTAGTGVAGSGGVFGSGGGGGGAGCNVGSSAAGADGGKTNSVTTGGGAAGGASGANGSNGTDIGEGGGGGGSNAAGTAGNGGNGGVGAGGGGGGGSNNSGISGDGGDGGRGEVRVTTFA